MKNRRTPDEPGTTTGRIERDRLKTLPAFPFGAVYFRKSNPPEGDWERDYETASEDGHNTFRHWFLWSAIERAPGTFDWSAYDRHLDLAAKYGIRTIIAEFSTAAPEWAYRAMPESQMVDRMGRKVDRGGMHGSCATGAGPGLCLDSTVAREAAGEFLKRLVKRYKDHPGMGGYDVMNECNLSPCWCPSTTRAWRRWLKKKYGDLDALMEAWHRYSYAGWRDVMAPTHTGPWPDVLDWQEFNIDRFEEHFRWRIDTIRKYDKKNAVTAHGIAGTLSRLGDAAAHDWRSADHVQVYGYTWGSSRHGDEPWKQFHAVDLVRAASRGKPFWHAESYGGPLWMAPNVIGRARDTGRIAYPEDVRYWHMASFMAGATGAMYLRWRPLLDGPLFGAFGPYGMDGSRTDRSEAGSKVAKWANDPAQEALWQSKPVRGDIAILFVPESELFTRAQQNAPDFYLSSAQGAYEGFFDNNIQADWVSLKHIEEYPAIYLPFPIMLKEKTARKLIKYVAKGGVLISEGCPGYFGDRGRAGTTQPSLGLDELFGVRESYVEFTPDLLDDLTFSYEQREAWGGTFLQAYEPMAGSACGTYEDGRIACVKSDFGEGRTLLIGTMCGTGYGRHPGNRRAEFFAEILSFTGRQQMITVSDNRIKARLHRGKGGSYLWVANPTREDLSVEVEIMTQESALRPVKSLWGPMAEPIQGKLKLDLPARDVSINLLG